MMNHYEKLARITTEFDGIAELYKVMVDAIDDGWRALRDDDDCEDHVARIRTYADELIRELEDLKNVCNAE